MMYVSPSQAKDELRLDHEVDDWDVEQKIKQASSMVKSYIKDTSPYEPERDDNDDVVLDSNEEPVDALDEDGERIVRYEVQAATVLLVRYMFDGVLADRYSIATPGSYLPPEVTAILYPLRVPTFA